MNIKNNMLNPVLTLYLPNKQLVAILSSKTIKLAYEIVKKITLNDITTLSFKIPFDNTVVSYDSTEMLVKFENDFYIIKTVELSDETVRTLSITCESEFVELKGIKCQTLTMDNASGKTPEELFNIIISSPMNVSLTELYKWAGTDIVNTYRFIESENGTSVFENLLTMCEKFSAWMELSTDSDNQKWIFLRKNAINNGKFLRKGQGLKSLGITYDSSSLFTRLHAYGSNDVDTGNPINITGVNPTGKLYVEDVSWFIAKGMTLEEIYVTPRSVQETDYTDSNITSVDTLFESAKEELAKVCIPVLSGKVGISDFSVYEDTATTEPMIGEEIIVVDQDISFNFKAQIQTIERKYSENPFDVSIEISNVIKYDSILKDLQHSSDTVKTVTSISNGVPTVNVNYISGVLNALKTSLIGTVDLTTTEDKQSTLAILFEDKRVGYPTYGAMGFGTMGLCIANELNTDGSWKWQTFGTSNGFNSSLIKTGILNGNNGDFLLNLDTGITHVATQVVGAKDNQIASTEFVQNEIKLKANETDNNRTTSNKTVTGAINELNLRQNIIIDTVTKSIINGTGTINLTINSLGLNPIIVTNGDYSLNTAQIVGIKNILADTIIVYYTNAIDGNCKFNFTYKK